MDLQAYCFQCEKKVTAFSGLPEDEFWLAVDRNFDIEVVHAADDGDHRWRLNDAQKKNLRKERAGGHI
jgi:hypothetical protein